MNRRNIIQKCGFHYYQGEDHLKWLYSRVDLVKAEQESILVGGFYKSLRNGFDFFLHGFHIGIPNGPDDELFNGTIYIQLTQPDHGREIHTNPIPVDISCSPGTLQEENRTSERRQFIRLVKYQYLFSNAAGISLALSGMSGGYPPWVDVLACGQYIKTRVT